MVIPLIVPIRSNSTYFSLLIVYALVVYSVLVSSLGLVVRVCSVVLFSFVCATSSFMCSSPRDSSIIRPFLVASTGYAVFSNTVCFLLVTSSLAVRMVMALSHAVFLLLHGVVVLLVSNAQPNYTHNHRY